MSTVILYQNHGAYLAAGEGFEPSQTESESGVLPLHNPAKRKCYYIRFFRFVKAEIQKSPRKTKKKLAVSSVRRRKKGDPQCLYAARIAFAESREFPTSGIRLSP